MAEDRHQATERPDHSSARGDTGEIGINCGAVSVMLFDQGQRFRSRHLAKLHQKFKLVLWYRRRQAFALRLSAFTSNKH
ncbi:hypothetical protein [Mesorhizobium huakuii]|uniref:Transposase n=1 Tax=Mesorhizobium huakuii TaxID=28104 RepID=A0ABZ0W0W5_9HYPH|nr:hypothetical protein [Mesorhizobium huakuii]WQC02612.1 hypothetical protein U0R22_006865 [Mesorhizobium huakuii]